MAVGVAGVLRFRHGRRALEHVEGGPRVAAGQRDEVLERRCRERHAAVRPERTGQAALLVVDRPTDHRRDIVVRQRLEAPDPHPRQERAVDLEVRILGRGADQGHGPVLDMRQQGVLLGLVEPVDLVEEEDAARALQGQSLLRLGDRIPDLDDARHDGRQAREMGADLGGEQPRQAGLAGSRRAPQEERREVAPADAPPERSAIADEMLLADELVQAARAHPGGQRLPLRRRLEEGFGSGAGQPARGWHDAMVAPGLPGRRSDHARQSVMCVTWTTTHRASRTATSVPPTIATRRTSRAT